MNNDMRKNKEYITLVNEIFQEEDENIKKYGNVANDLYTKIQYIFKDKIHSKCLNQMNEFTKNCEITRGNPSDTIKSIPGKEKECNEALNSFEQCQKNIQEVYEYYSNVLELSQSYTEKQKEICLEDCYSTYSVNNQNIETSNCLKDCVKVIHIGNKANCFFLHDYKKKILIDLKNL